MSLFQVYYSSSGYSVNLKGSSPTLIWNLHKLDMMVYTRVMTSGIPYSSCIYRYTSILVYTGISSGSLANYDIVVLTTISVYTDIDYDIVVP